MIERAGPDRHIPFAFVDDLDAPALDGATRHHLERVRRLRPGDDLTVGDGAGGFCRVRFGAELALAGDIVRVEPAAPAVTVAFALTKGDRPELVVQKLTELGVDHIAPFIADRTVVRWDPDKAARNAARLRTIAREAAAQAHRPWLPEVAEVAAFDQVVVRSGLALAEPGGGPITAATTGIAVGPEGGWAPSELDAATALVDLGPTILRAETAAVAAGALLVAVRDGRIADTQGG